jgi:hypothetical protein
VRAAPARRKDAEVNLNALVPIVALFIPIVAIGGGILSAVFRTHAQQRIAELAMQERIAAIQKGIDPATLPPIPSVADPAALAVETISPRTRALRRAQGLLVGAVVTFFAGVGLAIMLTAMDHRNENLWVVGVLPAFIGLGLGAASWIVRRGADLE